MLSRMLKAGAVLVTGAFVLADWVQAQPTRSGEEVVRAQCIKCHESGVDGAPKIDDRAAWIPRMKKGVDVTVRSAMRGHGKMPARGGIAEISDAELRAAILYMFYPAAAALKGAPAAASTPPADPHHKRVGGVDFYIGIAPAATAPTAQKGPRGRGHYYVTVSLHDSATDALIKDAQVEARAANPVTGGESKTLELVTLNGAAAYGGFFRMDGAEPYAITVRARRGKDARTLEAKFDFKP